MKIRDENLWQLQRSELQEDQVGKDFLAFVEGWASRAEDLLDDLDPASALRKALEQADQDHGRVSIHFLGQMLVVIGTHWEHGEQMIEGLTPIELRLVQDMLALKCAELEKLAEESGNG